MGEALTGWEIKTLADSCDINPETLKRGTPEDYEFDYISIESIPELGVIGETQRIIFKEAPSRARRVVRTDDVMVSTVRPYLKSFAIAKSFDEPKVCSTGFAVLRANENSNPDYLYQFVCSDVFVKQLEKAMVGSNYPAVNSSDVASTNILLPPLPEQKKIAAILSSVDDAIAKTKAVIEQTKKLKKGMMQKLLTRGIGHTKFKKTEIGEIPEEWELLSLGDLAHKVQDGNYGAKYPKSSEFLDEGVPFLTSTAISTENIIIHSKIKFVSPEKHSELNKAHIQENDVLFTNRGANVGCVALTPINLDDANIGPQLTLIRCTDLIMPKFLYLFMQSLVFAKQLKQLDSGSAMNFFGIKSTKGFKICTPPIEEQKKLIQFLGQIDTKILKNQSVLKSLTKLKGALMQQLLTGKVRVTV